MTLNTSSYYDQGYADGLKAAGNSIATGKAHIEYQYHKHIDANGNVTTATQSSTKGGCFTNPVYHKHTNSCYTDSGYNCGPRNKVRGPYKNHSGTDEYQYTCSACGRDWYMCDGGSASGTFHWVGSKVLSCGKTTTTVEYYTLGCSKTTSTIVGGTIVWD